MHLAKDLFTIFIESCSLSVSTLCILNNAYLLSLDRISSFVEKLFRPYMRHYIGNA